MEENNRVCFVCWGFFVVSFKRIPLECVAGYLDTFVGFKMAEVLRCITFFLRANMRKA